MRRAEAALFGLVALLTLTAAANVRWQRTEPTDDPSVPSWSHHPGTTLERYRQPYLYEPHGNTAILLAGGNASHHAIALAELKAMRDGTGFWADSVAFHGLLPRMSFAVPVDSIQESRVGSYMNLAELQDIASYGEDQFEILVDVPAAKSLGWRGKNGTARVTYGGVTGMSLQYVSTALDAWQTGLTSKIGRSAYGIYLRKQQLGLESTLEDHGFGYAVEPAIHLQNIQSAYDANDGFAMIEPTSDWWPGARFSLTGSHNRWLGWHEIGSDLPIYHIGARSWNSTNDNSTTHADSTAICVDVAIHTRSTWLLVIDGVVGGAGANDISLASFRQLLAHVARRSIEEELNGHPRLTTLTTEQLRKRKQGRRGGNLFDPDGFAVLCTTSVPTGNPYDYGRKPSKIYRPAVGGVNGAPNFAPIGFSMATQHWVGGTSDSILPPGSAVGTGAAARLCVLNGTVDGDSVGLSYPHADSVSHGMGYGPTGNTFQCGFHDNARGRPLSFQIPTSGCDDGPVWVYAEFMIHSNITTPFATCSLYVAGFLGQFAQMPGDHMNEGPSSGHPLSATIRYRQGPDSVAAMEADSLIWKFQALPQFSNWWVAVDTTSAGSVPLMFDHAGTGWRGQFMRQFMWKSSNELLPWFVGTLGPVGSGFPDIKTTLGNPVSLTLPAVGGHETYLSDVTVVKEKGRIYSARIPVEINRRTRWIGGYLVLENAGGNLSAVPVMSWLHISARQGSF